MSLHVPKEVGEYILNVYQSVLNHLVLQPWRQLLVKRLDYESLVARLALFYLNCVHKIVPDVGIKPFSMLVYLYLTLFPTTIEYVLHRDVNLINEHFCLFLFSR